MNLWTCTLLIIFGKTFLTIGSAIGYTFDEHSENIALGVFAMVLLAAGIALYVCGMLKGLFIFKPILEQVY
jgi:hypothetical protein